MSVFKPKGSPYYHYDFQRRGRRFYGSTKRTDRRQAQAVERAERERAKHTSASITSASMTLDDAAGRYWHEVGQHHAGADNTERDLARLIEYFGAARQLDTITDDDVARLVAWRRGHRVIRNKEDKPENCRFISNATVNRSTTEVVKKLFTRAKRAWGLRFDREPDWRAHMLKEADERIRELHEDESERLNAAMREDYAPLFDFVRVTGQRKTECYTLRWPEVDWSTRQITRKGKGQRTIIVPITDAVREILWPLRGHHSEFVFTYTVQRTRDGKVKGERRPITKSGLNTRWRRMRKAAGVSDFRFHDFRHDLATKVLRETGNLKLVQRVLNHANIKTTARYAHVIGDDIVTALDRVQNYRKKSRSLTRKMS
jgi:integrase